ncbi:2'-5' RNA ligase family protein [Pelagibius sp. Alg239-R121]|uniref:2'-5' RNA ligase family protein n=1 Tax=Pelagibius sp. Alg239-R121 TaxID=2993448 RepID=UPI0024A6E4D5|nr:2'-5' RNA ligase family protein [Pelagibius sp. Alg239-R121]
MLQAKAGAGSYTLWLLPCKEDEAWLRSVIVELSAELGTEAFDPHVTILGGLSGIDDSTEAGIQRIADDHSAITAQVDEIGFLPEVFRAFFLSLGGQPALTSLFNQSKTLESIYSRPEFTPHVSLVYGEPDLTVKQALKLRLQDMVSGRSLRFDRLGYAYSGKGVPIPEWRIDHFFRLARQPST